jgi:hypothetical protein
MNDRRSRLNDAIDRAVRDLVQHDPRPGFRRRVLTAIDAPARRSHVRLALAAAAVAMVVFAVLLVRRGPDPVDPATTQVANVPTPPAAAPPSTTQSSPDPLVDEPPRHPTAPRPRASRRAPRPEATATAPPPVFGPAPGRVAATALPDETAAAPAAGGEVPRSPTAPAIGVLPLPYRPAHLIRIALPPVQIRPSSAPR